MGLFFFFLFCFVSRIFENSAKATVGRDEVAASKVTSVAEGHIEHSLFTFMLVGANFVNISP